MAGQRQPVELIIANGKKHLTKAEIKERKSAEVKAPVGNVAPPDYLPDTLKKKFNDLSSQLLKINIMSELDVDLLARYLLSEQVYLALTKKYMSAISRNDTEQIDKLSTSQDKAFKQCLSTAKELGLTISSRCKLVIPKTEDEPESKFGQFIQGGAG